MSKKIDQTALVASANEMAAHQGEIMQRFGDGLPYDRIRVVGEARFYMAQSAEAMLEAGKRLIVLKENEPHGEFEIIMQEQLNLSPRIAQKMMQASVKYLSPKLESKAKSLSHLGRTKLYELMLEDDEELVELAEGGTLAGLTLDDVDRMTTRELRRALREARENAAAVAKVTAAKDDKINKLDAELTRLKSKATEPLIEALEPDAKGEQLLHETRVWADEIKARIDGKLLPAFRALSNHDMSTGSQHQVEMAAMLASIEFKLNCLRGDFDLPRQLDGDSTPDWLREDADEVVAAALEQAQGGAQ